ncbi:molecular chaperone TorD family protein [Bacillus sp. ISL-35]|uniref:molecular chaperone TorD family protein n=1 Tax=Bacillus sp. ISL-35 TaxID=2819122 RepID=UPI001BEAC115|nr:molecular chaperone TorD family protein [Bacillus sp. ISL-35]MBT2681440.1 molecular chaperone TorD family protein [Bacillus sp. ISL-35]MBT2701907.1 molecular chaperone TorD family protein [Chryseobacterium sp. ISL-80]
MMESIEKRAETAMVFTIIADLYKPPALETWKEIEQNHLLKKLELMARDLYGFEFPLEGILPDNFEHFCEIHRKAIGSAEEKAVLPIESLYKPWTQDETCTLPFAREKGYLQGDPAMHIRFILNELQMEIPIQYKGIPDHLSILLELAAYFIEHAPEKFSSEFIEDHLDWLGEFEIQLIEKSSPPFYGAITGFLIKVIDAQQKMSF